MSEVINPYELPLIKKVKKAILAIREYESFVGEQPALPGLEDNSGYQLCFSGGKDSSVIKALADMAGVKYTGVYSVTTIDPPELVKFIKKEHPDVIRHRPEKNFFHYMVEKGFPLRQRRWCCDVYKHNTGFARIKILGIRAQESAKRANNWKVLTRWNGGGEIRS
jgi:phosphoadenosine phosphosulfate reductase